MLDLDALDAPGAGPRADAAAGQGRGQPLQIAPDLIDEDPAQPRREFDAAALQELAATIAARGVRQPVSVRPHPAAAGRWMLNFGARRLRASRLAGMALIPAFVDETADGYDQVVENEQRQGLRPLEIALFVQRRLALGESQAEIARRLGKSRQWVTLATALIDAPPWLLQAYRDGRCRGLAELYELRRLHAEHPGQVPAWLAQCDSATRERVAALRASLRASRAAAGVASPAVAADVPARPARDESQAGDTAPAPAATRPPGPHVLVELDGQLLELDVSTPPATPGRMYVRPLRGGPRRTVDAAALTLRGFAAR
jgi:ParB family chromosome partitioning protein